MSAASEGPEGAKQRYGTIKPDPRSSEDEIIEICCKKFV
jgi:hypothetical protein